MKMNKIVAGAWLLAVPAMSMAQSLDGNGAKSLVSNIKTLEAEPVRVEYGYSPVTSDVQDRNFGKTAAVSGTLTLTVHFADGRVAHGSGELNGKVTADFGREFLRDGDTGKGEVSGRIKLTDDKGQDAGEMEEHGLAEIDHREFGCSGSRGAVGCSARLTGTMTVWANDEKFTPAR